MWSFALSLTVSFAVRIGVLMVATHLVANQCAPCALSAAPAVFRNGDRAAIAFSTVALMVYEARRLVLDYGTSSPLVGPGRAKMLQGRP